MDRELAVPWRRDVLVSAILSGIAHRSHRTFVLVRTRTLVTAGRAHHRASSHPASMVSAIRPGDTATNRPPRDPRSRADSDTVGHADWMPLCTQSTLPVLRVHRVGNSVPAVACWGARRADLCHFSGSGVGMECVSEHPCQLVGCCIKFGSRSCCDLGRHAAR